MFEPWTRLLLGLITGLLFGFLLQKGRVAKFRTIVGQFLLKDFTVVKIMGTAILVGGAGILYLHSEGYVEMHIKPLLLGGVLIGGFCFGAGMALLGYCPGTGVAACGEGRRDAMVGVLGMLVGAGVYVAAYPWLQPIVHAWYEGGELTWPAWTNTEPWYWFGGLVVAALFLIGIADQPNMAHRFKEPPETIGQQGHAPPPGTNEERIQTRLEGDRK